MTESKTATEATPPFFLCERGYAPGTKRRWGTYTVQGVYASLTELGADVEATDVLDGSYRAFDASGRVVDLVPIDPHGVRATVAREAELLPVDLEIILRRSIAARGDTDLARDPDASLSTLVGTFHVVKLRTGFRARMESAVALLIVLAIAAIFILGLATLVGWAVPETP